jgi:hypothetical protein
MSKGKGSKNNVDNKVKKKEYKTIDSTYCEKNCKEFCKDYYNYCEKLHSGKVMKGLICKK